MKVKQILIAVLCLLMISISGYAQPDKALSDRMEALKVSFVTKKLQLNTEEAKLFWPVYNEFDAEKKELRQKRRALIGELREEENDENQMNQDVEVLMRLRVQEAELDQKYYEAFKEVVGVEKAAAFFRVEEEFKRVLLRQHDQREDGERMPPR